jgi:hypothetical protein
MDAWRRPKHVEDYDTIKCLWKCIKLVTLLWYIMIHGQQNIKNTYFMQQSPSWEANPFAVSQEIPHIFWKPKFHYRIHKCSPPVIVLPSAPGSSEWPLSLRFPPPNPVYASPFPHTCYMPRPFDPITRLIFGEQYRSQSSSLGSLLHSPDNSTNFIYNKSCG